METPQYTLYLSIPRILIPKSLTLIFLGGFLYFGVWLNLLILNYIIPADYHLYIILGIIVLVVMQAILNYIKFSNYKYYFYKDRLIFEGKKQLTIMLNQVQNLAFSKDVIDKIFNTGIIILAPVHKIKYVKNTNQVYFYLQKLVQYAQGSIPPQVYGQQQRTNQYYQQQV
ncbi:hypothetical protein GOV08_05385 [Candidatus Woesearchaeota archaeon]|nr:hypothetical protein [Candidatus Woesearchaeota archaeon]